MSIAPPGFLVKGPKLISKRPKYGLFSVVTPERLSDPHAWAGGVEWEFDLCTSLEAFTDQCPPNHTNSVEKDLEFCRADPFIVKSSFQCSVGGKSVKDAVDIANRRLYFWEEHKVEEIFWSGQTANGSINPSLAFGNDTCDIEPEIIGSNLSPISAFAVLEEALTDIVPGGGIIHVPHGLASYLADKKLIKEDNGVYFSPTGTPVVIGSGYSGTGPGNIVPDTGTTYIYATGPMAIWRSDVIQNPEDVFDGIDRYINNVTVFVERFYAVGFSCALYTASVCL